MEDEQDARGEGEEPRQPGVLVEPARHRLVQVAAEVLGRLPAERVPGSLKALARFTPSRRARLGAPALSAALDADADFRQAVAEALTDSMPDLVAALEAGRPLGASDPLDVAVCAFLVRPEGWEDVVADAGSRWGREREQQRSDLAAAELERLRGELDRMRAQLRADTVAARADVEAELAEARAELAEVRRRLRIRTGELRAAERARDEAVAAAKDVQARADAAQSAQEAEARRYRARIGELEQAGTAARRASRWEREVDDARLWLLVETLGDAVAGIRRELALSPPGLRPGDTVAGGAEQVAASGARRVADGAALERLLTAPTVHLVVDGYNVTKSGFPELSLADQRSRLIGGLTSLAGRTGMEVTVAFDGAERPAVQPAMPRGIRVLFSAAGEIADDLIRRLVDAEPPGRPVVVVSSDQQVATDVRAAGAWSAPATALLALL